MKNRVVLIVDASPSIRPYQGEIVKLVKNTLATIASAKPDSEVSMILFDSSVNVLYSNVPATSAEPLKMADYNLGSGTAIFDAVKKAVQITEVKKDEDYTYVFLVLTDGEDNSSRNLEPADVAEYMREYQKTDRFTFAYMMPPEFVAAFLKLTKMPAGNVMAWGKVEEAEAAATTGFATYYTGLASGKKSTSSFFEVNTAKLTKKEIKKNLTNVASSVKILPIKGTKPTTVGEVLKAKKIPFKKGIVWYRLDKKEKVSAKKKVRIMVQGSPEVWDGDEAMSMVGFQPGVDSVVVPGNLGNKKVFVLSTSGGNRKLYPGSEILVDV